MLRYRVPGWRCRNRQRAWGEATCNSCWYW